MDDNLMHRAEQRGFITRPEVFDSGYDDRDIRDAIASGLLTRIGPGLYALSTTYAPLSAEAQHVVRSRAVVHRLGDGVVLSHHSAALMHGLPVWGHDLTEVHVTRRDGKRGRHESGVHHHIGVVSDSQITDVNGALVVSPARAVWEVACSGRAEQGIVTADAALHNKLVSHETLLEAAGQFAQWQGSRTARLALTLADGRAESPGESRTRHLFWRFNIPKPDLQFSVVGRQGHTIARTDFAWEAYRHLAEFDGRIKYDGTFGDTGFSTVFDEKRREDLVRAELWGMSRLIWAHLHPNVAASTAARVLAELERSRSLYGRTIIT